MRHKVLCVEDDPTVQALVNASLRDFSVTMAPSLKMAEDLLSKSEFDAVLLDIALPDGDGLKFFIRLNQDSKFKRVPTLILSGNNDISNKLTAFSFGADDFITKPFDPLELKARLASKILKSQSESDEKKVRRLGDIEIDFDRQRVSLVRNGQEKDLSFTSIEIKILTLLSRRTEQVFSRNQILESVWGQTSITDRTVDSHVAHLRNKMADSSVVIDTVKNFGYRVVVK